MAAVTLTGVSVRIEDRHVLHTLDLEVRDGELLAVVGPSGSGKTTLLRVIAGLEHLAAGDITIGGRSVVDLRPADRRISMVFQDNTLLPFSTARANVEFPLKMAGSRHRGPAGSQAR